MTFIYSDENTDTINQLLNSQGEIKCAVAFLGHAAIDIFQNASKETKIICNLESGATNPFTVEELIKLGIQVKTIGKLHTKVYLNKDRRAIVGSANLSANGLSYEDDEVSGWLEAGVLIEDKKTLSEINAWFDTQWNVALPITDDRIENAKQLWRRRRNNRGVINNDESILESLRNNPESFKDKNIFIAIYRCDNPSEEALQKFIEVSEDINDVIDFYEDWDDLPEDSYFISIYYGRRGRVRIDPYYYIPEDKILLPFNDESKIILVFKKDYINGMTLTNGDEALLRSKIDELWTGQDNNEGVCISLYDARDTIFGA